MIVIVDDTWLFLIGLGKLPMSFQRQFRKNLKNKSHDHTVVNLG